MSLGMAAFAALAMVILLFVLAALAERQGERLRRLPRLRHLAYTLALGVYCSSWTFYGAVGSAARDGWSYLPIYLGPILLLLLGRSFLVRLAQAVADEKATTISDFIAARFGHDVVVARLVTIIALAGTVPYVALQFRSIGNAISMVSGANVDVLAMIGTAVLLALFAMLFGARRFEFSGRNDSLLYAIGFESLFKLAALLLVGGFAVLLLLHAPAAAVRTGMADIARGFDPAHFSVETVVIGLISVMAIVVLPRQFYMGLAEAHDAGDLPRARLGLAAYLAIMAAVVPPIAVAGAVVLNSETLGGHGAADLYVLQLPAMMDRDWLVVVALLGGISAAASMVIVDATALATMVSNDLLFPSILARTTGAGEGVIGSRMLLVRRASIMAIIACALAWAMLISAARPLASIGLVAFAAMAQFTPHLIMAVNRAGRDPLAARISLSLGLGLWLYTLALPPILPEPWLAALAGGPFDPQRLFGIGRASPLVHGVGWSLGVNLASFAVVRARSRVPGTGLPLRLRPQQRVSDLADLVRLTASFIGRERAEAEFPESRRGSPAERRPIDRTAAHRARQLIGQVVGASSARTLVASAMAGGQMNLDDVTRLLDEGGQSLRFSRQLLASTFENMDAGISVVDADLNLVAWNSRYIDLFDYPAGLVRVGAPIAELIRHNAVRGHFGPGDIDLHVAKRLEHLRRRQEHGFERRRADGRVIKTVGGPMPGGGYVMSFTDITEEARVRGELQRTLETLEARVAERTRDLREANRLLASAARDKTRFLAAASHDLLQPLHAARLFTGALERDVAETSLPLVRRVESSIVAAEELLRALLDISKLDAGGVQPKPEDIALEPFLTGLAAGIRPIAEEKGLRLRLGPLAGSVTTDPGLLRSVLQNFLVNAVRYTPAGSVLLGVRRRGAMLRIDVIDTGVGIPEGQVATIFREFTRLGEVEAEGFGLGLALVERIVRLLDGRVEVASTPGRGSRFSLYLEAAGTAGSAMADDDDSRPGTPAPVPAPQRLRVLVVDNEPRIVEASLALLASLGHEARGTTGRDHALELADDIDAVLADYHLDDGANGLDLITLLRRRRPGLPAALITAETAPELRRDAEAMQVPVFAKPVSPAAIAAFLADVAAHVRSVVQIKPQ